MKHSGFVKWFHSSWWLKYTGILFVYCIPTIFLRPPGRFSFCGTSIGPGETRAQTSSQGPQIFDWFRYLCIDGHWIKQQMKGKDLSKHFEVPTNLQLFNLDIWFNWNTVGIFRNAGRKGREGSWTCRAPTTGPGESIQPTGGVLVFFFGPNFGTFGPNIGTLEIHDRKFPLLKTPSLTKRPVRLVLLRFISGSFVLSGKEKRRSSQERSWAGLGPESPSFGYHPWHRFWRTMMMVMILLMTTTMTMMMTMTYGWSILANGLTHGENYVKTSHVVFFRILISQDRERKQQASMDFFEQAKKG